jgi:hypothetical protein
LTAAASALLLAGPALLGSGGEPSNAATATTATTTRIADFDNREFRITNSRQRERSIAARDSELRALAASTPGLAADWSPRFQSPIFLRSTRSMLTAADPGGDPARIIAGFVGSHPGLFRVPPATLSQARVIRDAQSDPAGLRSYWLGQFIDGIPVYGCDLRATLTADNAIATIGSTLLDLDPAKTDIGNSLCELSGAVSAAAELLGATAEELAALDRNGLARAVGGDGLFGHLTDEPVYIPVSRGRIELGRRLTVQLRGSPDRYEILTIGENPTPAILRNLTRYAGPMATYRIYPGESPTPMSPGAPIPNGDQPIEQSRVLVTIDALDPIASPEGWVDPALMTTIGNNIIAHADLLGDNSAEGGFPDGGSGLVFDFPIDLSDPPASYTHAAVTQAFYTANRFHDIMHAYGFTEGFGCFQGNNFGRGGVDGDPIRLDVQDGSAFNNARFVSTGADGSAALVELFLWTGTSPQRDSALDNQVVIHELTHGVTDRLLLGIGGAQGNGMGEGWSDYFALSLLSEPGIDASLTFPFGAYVASAWGDTPFLNSYYFGLRRFPYSTDTGFNPLTYNDIDPAKYATPAEIPINTLVPQGNPAGVHQVGEIWCAALWEGRAAFVAEEGPGGAAMFDRLVIDSLKLLTTPEPNMVMARDAMLLADLINHDGAHLCSLWEAFAKRGLGVDAFSPPTDIRGVQESFATPDTPLLLALSATDGGLRPGPDTEFRIGVDRNCSAPESIAAPRLRVSINNGPYTMHIADEVTADQFALRFPTLLCGDVVQYYFEIDTESGVVSLPESGAGGPFVAQVAVDPTLDRVRADDRGSFDFFGFDADLDDGVLIVGSWQNDNAAINSGAAYLFEPAGPTSWEQRVKLTPPSSEFNINFGFRVAISGGVIAVSAIKDSAGAPKAGAVHMFRRDAQGGWLADGVLTSLDGEENDQFGSGLAIADEATVYVGSSGNDTAGTNAGAVYAFTRAESGGWTQRRRLLADDAGSGDRFGEAVASEGDTLLIGAPGESSASGAVYCYRRTGASKWAFEQQITPANRVIGAEFGASIDIDHDRIIVGAPADTDMFQDVGVAYVLHRDPITGVWSPEGRLVAPFQRGLDEFGYAVAIEGDLAVVTALRSDLFETDAGAAFAYERTPTGWEYLDRITPQAIRSRIQFGSAVALDDGVAAVGAWLDGEDRSATGSVSLYRPVAIDCDGNGIADECEIASGELSDSDLDGIPDLCACPGDLNGDSRVDTADLGALIGQFGMHGTPADLNGDGVVDQADLGLVLERFGQECLQRERRPDPRYGAER